MLDGVFWSCPPDHDDVRPTDPIGLDAMREELSDRLVPCLTGRTRNHEGFFWALVFLHWAALEKSYEDGRVQRFLHWERCLKMHWAHQGRDGFTGVNSASTQAGQRDAPRTAFAPLLKNQRAQGMLGAHLGPLRKLGLVSDSLLALVDEGPSLVAGAGDPPQLRDGDWAGWTRAFSRAEKALGPAFRKRLRDRLRTHMPDLHRALSAMRWRRTRSWGQAALHIGPSLTQYASLAHEFIPWADALRELFHQLIRSAPTAPTPKLPSPLRGTIPDALARWEPLRHALRAWRRKHADRVLANLHRRVFSERGYERDLWIQWEDGRRITYPGRASFNVAAEGSDCRWANAVTLMRPGA